LAEFLKWSLDIIHADYIIIRHETTSRSFLSVLMMSTGTPAFLIFTLVKKKWRYWKYKIDCIVCSIPFYFKSLKIISFLFCPLTTKLRLVKVLIICCAFVHTRLQKILICWYESNSWIYFYIYSSIKNETSNRSFNR
jgi:hypothetical protein